MGVKKLCRLIWPLAVYTVNDSPFTHHILKSVCKCKGKRCYVLEKPQAFGHLDAWIFDTDTHENHETTEIGSALYIVNSSGKNTWK